MTQTHDSIKAEQHFERDPNSNGSHKTPTNNIVAPVDFLIVTALEEELQAVLRRLPGHSQLAPSEEDVRVYYAAVVEATMPGGAKCTYSVAIVCLMNMGRVQATATTGDAIRRWRPDYVLLVGIAGGLKAAGVNIGDILIAEQIADYESQKITKNGAEIRWTAQPVDTRPLEFSRAMPKSAWQSAIAEPRPSGDISAPNWHIGTITTGDKVVAVDGLLESFRKQNWPKLIGVEMEAGGVALAAHQAAHRCGFFMIRCVSDQAGNKASRKTKSWRPYACDAAGAYAITLVKRGPVPANRLSNARSLGGMDELAAEMTRLSFAELQTVIGYVTEQPAKAGVDFTLLTPQEKMSKNRLGTRTHDQLVIGLSKAQMVREYVSHVSKIDPRFPEKIKAGFLAEYRQLTASGSQGDALFDRLVAFSCGNDQRLHFRAAGLAVLTYMFEMCDVFEK